MIVMYISASFAHGESLRLALRYQYVPDCVDSLSCLKD